MSSIELPEKMNHRRRRLVGGVATGIASALFGEIVSAYGQTDKTMACDPVGTNSGRNTSFAAIKQIKAGVLNVGYAEAGPENGPAVILLHGWPYDIYSYVDVAPVLASAGYRVIVPYARGYGTTRFLSGDGGPKRPARGARRRCHRFDGCSQNPESNSRRL